MSMLGKELRAAFRFFVIFVSLTFVSVVLVGFAWVVLIGFFVVIVEQHIIRMFSSHGFCYSICITQSLRDCGRINANLIAGFSRGYFVIVIVVVVIVIAIILVG